MTYVSPVFSLIRKYLTTVLSGIFTKDFARKDFKKFTYGFSGHVLVDADTDIVLTAQIAPTSVSESKMLESLLEDLTINDGVRVFADKGYSGKSNCNMLQDRKL